MKKNVTRADLRNRLISELGLPRAECKRLVEIILDELTETLLRGESAKIPSFGTFVVCQKGRRIGRNPRTGEEVMIEPRRVAVFRPSITLRKRVNDV